MKDNINKGSILVCLDCYKSTYGGNFIASLKKLESKINQYNVVYLIDETCSNRCWYKELIKDGASTEIISDKLNVLAKIKIYKKIIKKYKVKLIHVHFGDRVSSTMACMLSFNTKIIWHNHSDFSMGKKFSLIKIWKLGIQNFIFKIFKNKMQRISVSKYLSSKEKSIFVANGIATDRIKIIDELEKKKIRKQLGIKNDSIVVTIYGWSPEVKGVDIAALAVREARKEIPNLELCIVEGKDPNVLKDFFERHKLQSDMQFIHILPPTQDVFIYHNITDIYLSSSRSEGFSYTMCESIILGKPVITSDIFGIEWTKKFKSVFFFESENTLECAKKIIECYRNINNHEYKKFLKEDKLSAINYYNADRWADDIIKVYERLLTK